MRLYEGQNAHFHRFLNLRFLLLQLLPGLGLGRGLDVRVSIVSRVKVRVKIGVVVRVGC